MRVVHHVRRVAARRAHVDLEADEIALLAEAFLVLGEAEELEMNEAAAHAKRLDRRAASAAQRLRHVSCRVVREIELLEHDVHDGWRPGRRRLEERLGVRVEDGIVGEDLAVDEFLHDVRHRLRLRRVEVREFIVAVELVGIAGADAVVRLDDDRVADHVREVAACLERRDLVQARRRHACLCIVRLHGRLVLDAVNVVVLLARRHMEIRAQARILLEPELVIRLDPVNLTVFEREEAHGPHHLLVVVEMRQVVILRQRILEFF